jgi:hypothetical protein
MGFWCPRGRVAAQGGRVAPVPRTSSLFVLLLIFDTSLQCMINDDYGEKDVSVRQNAFTAI